MRKIGLAGAGWVTAHHLEAWSTFRDRATIVAIADPDVAAANSRAAAFGIPAVFESVEEMLSRVQMDALDVAAPREFHATACRMAADKGIDVLCQKPLCPTFYEAEELVRDIGTRARLMVHENWRFRPHYRQVRQWLAAGRIGEVRTASMSILTSGLLPDSTGALPALVRQPMLAGLERMLLMEVMIHHVDTLRFLFGTLDLLGATIGKSCAQIRGEDRAALSLRSSSCSAISLDGDFMAHGHPPEQFDDLEIQGTRGAITLRRDTLSLVAAATETQKLDLRANYAASYRDAIGHFLDRLDDGEPFETSAEDNLETLRIVEAAYAIGGP